MSGAQQGHIHGTLMKFLRFLKSLEMITEYLSYALGSASCLEIFIPSQSERLKTMRLICELN